jgi:hypothetical protein
MVMSCEHGVVRARLEGIAAVERDSRIAATTLGNPAISPWSLVSPKPPRLGG